MGIYTTNSSVRLYPFLTWRIFIRRRCYLNFVNKSRNVTDIFGKKSECHCTKVHTFVIWVLEKLRPDFDNFPDVRWYILMSILISVHRSSTLK